LLSSKASVEGFLRQESVSFIFNHWWVCHCI